jgi:hypothetical protein
MKTIFLRKTFFFFLIINLSSCCSLYISKYGKCNEKFLCKCCGSIESIRNPYDNHPTGNNFSDYFKVYPRSKPKRFSSPYFAIVYLNFVEEGMDNNPVFGRSSSPNDKEDLKNQSLLGEHLSKIKANGNENFIRGYPPTEALKKREMDIQEELTKLFAGYAILFTTEEPKPTWVIDTRDYITIRICSRRREGLLSPWDPGDNYRNEIAEVYSLWPDFDSLNKIAIEIAHCIGHTFGLEDIEDDNYIMSYGIKGKNWSSTSRPVVNFFEVNRADIDCECLVAKDSLVHLQNDQEILTQKLGKLDNGYLDPFSFRPNTNTKAERQMLSCQFEGFDGGYAGYSCGYVGDDGTIYVQGVYVPVSGGTDDDGGGYTETAADVGSPPPPACSHGCNPMPPVKVNKIPPTPEKKSNTEIGQCMYQKAGEKTKSQQQNLTFTLNNPGPGQTNCVKFMGEYLNNILSIPLTQKELNSISNNVSNEAALVEQNADEIKGPQPLLVKKGLGEVVESLDNSVTGDIVQLYSYENGIWRGHQFIILNRQPFPGVTYVTMFGSQPGMLPGQSRTIPITDKGLQEKRIKLFITRLKKEATQLYDPQTGEFKCK